MSLLPSAWTRAPKRGFSAARELDCGREYLQAGGDRVVQLSVQHEVELHVVQAPHLPGQALSCESRDGEGVFSAMGAGPKPRLVLTFLPVPTSAKGT